MCGAMVITMLTGENSNVIEEHVPVNRDIVIDKNDLTSNGTESSSDIIKNNISDNALAEEKNSTLASESKKQMAITGEFINNKLESNLPSGFPMKNTEVCIEEDGVIIKGTIVRDKLKEYISKIDNKSEMKYSIALILLPDEFNVEAAFLVNKNGSDIEVKSKWLKLSGKQFSADNVPQEITSSISKAFNKIIDAIDEKYIFSGFEDGALIFEKID